MTEPLVFISYSEQDEKEKATLLSQLGVLESDGLIDVWSNDRISAGADWEAEIRQTIAQARVAILLISVNFLTSEFILGQVVPSLLQRHESEGLVVFPIIARACAWQTIDWLAKMKVRPRDEKPVWRGDESRVDRELAAIATEVAAIVSGTQSISTLEPPLQSFEPNTILIPAGPFLMGSDDDDDNEAPQHEIDLPIYHIGKYPITNREYAEFIKRTRYEPPERPNWDLREPPEGKLDHPVAGVSWLDAVAYCQWLSEETGRSYRLPTEAEWEKAASWADGQKCLHPWGDVFDANNCNSKEAALNDTTPAGSYSPQGDSFYGCADMMGNVQEWTSTLWGSSERENYFPYPYQANDGREDLEASHLHFVLRVYRGSSFRDDQSKARCTLRRYTSHKGSSRWRGFRVVLEI